MMEAEYGVGIKNRFAFLDGDGDNEGESTTRYAPGPEKSKSIVAESKILVEKKSVDGRVSGKRDNKAVAGSGNRNNNANAPTRDKFVKGKGQPPAHEDRRTPRENGGAPPAERTFRQGQGGRGGPRRENQRGGGGEHNRRNYNRARYGENRGYGDGEAENANETEPKETNGPTVVVETEADAEQIGETQEEKGEGDSAKNMEKTLTLAEWKALQAPREKPVFNTRKPGEGEITSKLEKLVLKKREDDIGGSDQQEEEYEVDEVYYPQRAGKLKLVADVGFTTGYQKQRRGGKFGTSSRYGAGDGNQDRERNPPSERRNMGDRPRGNRGRPRFDSRGGHQRAAHTQAPRIDDASDFPTLG